MKRALLITPIWQVKNAIRQKIFLIKTVQKKEIKRPKKNNKRKAKKSEKQKNEAKWKQSKICVKEKEICQGNYEKKRFIIF